MKKALCVTAALLVSVSATASAFAPMSGTTQIGVQITNCGPCGYIWQDHKDTPEEAEDSRIATYLWSD